VLPHHASIFPLPNSRRLRQRFALLLSVAVVFWLLACATHLHTEDLAQDGGKQLPSCNLCVTLGAGAAPPPAVVLPSIVPAATGLDDIASVAPPIPGFVASYRSRAPPI
jgi:hypothetical protein